MQLWLLRLFSWQLGLTSRVLKKVQILENLLISKKKFPRIGMRDLSPTKLADKDRGYSKVLKWALDNKSIKNLAVSGPYGSGKSSIIQTFQLRHPEYRYINISLASFEKTDDGQVELVLLSILQQIFYYVKSKSMPDSRYKRIHPVSKKGLLIKSIVLIAWAASLCFVLKPDLFKAFPEWEALLVTYPWIRYIFIAILFGGGIAVLYYFLKLYNNSQLNKLNIASGQLEVQPKNESSILNKHLDEILYFFEISRYDVVIIEDIDRFTKENTAIFTKLREINTLINNAQQIGRHVVFVYAIRDEVFKNEDRTKFFDFILPVIPVINSSNSGDQLSIQLAEAGLSGLIDPNFISKMSDYITDMRMLINIMNEFLVYKKTIGNFDFEHNNLIGMVIYKNIEPDDFALLQDDKGILFGFIHDRQTYNEPLTANLNEQYIALQADINSIENAAISSIQELRALYLFGLFSRLPVNATGQIDIGGGFMALKEFTTDDNFTRVRSSDSITYQYGSSSNYGLQQKTVKYAFSEVDAEVGHGQSYDQREKLIKIKAENRVDEKKKELEGLQEQINRIRFAKIKELSTIGNLEVINPKLAGKQLLVYLLEKGYVDEHYRNYISYFYAESMTSADRDFIMGVNYSREMDIGFKLEKVNEVVKNLSIDDFNKPQTLNISLLDFLLLDVETYNEQIVRVFAQISGNGELAKSVREMYRKDGNQKANFTFQLTKSWPKFWEYIQLESNYSDDLKRKYLEDMLNFGALTDIIIQNNNNLLETYISEMKDFQEFAKKLTSQAQTDQILEQLGVKFTGLSTIEDNHLFNLVHQQNLYEINRHMMDLLIRFSAEKRIKPLTGFETGQYTFLRQFEDEKILSYVQKNISEYLSNVLLKLDGNTEESENSILAILNNEDVPKEQKIQLLAKQTVKIQALINVQNTELWTDVVHANKMAPTWYNVTVYFEQISELDPVLADFLNFPDNYKVLEKELVANDTDIASEDIGSFYDQIITSNLLQDTTLVHLIKSMPHTFQAIDLTGVSSDRVALLLNNNFLEMNQENYDLLKANHNGKNIEFLEFFAEESPDWWSDITFDANDYRLLFNSNVFTLADKFIIAESMPLEILKEDFQIADTLSQLYAGSNLEIPDNLFNAVITEASNEELKIQMALQQNANFSTERYRELLQLLGPAYKSIVDEPKLAKLPNTPYNLELARLLDDRDVISSVTGQNEDMLRLNMYHKDK
ncbi:MAG: hypothetical protein EOO42_00625 [Flavobacteriales bacterium]|nr:MAG: hypothetical protein EOO42_00625 [Flavobacteriales bacterium]